MTSDAPSIKGKQFHRQNWGTAILALHEMLPYGRCRTLKFKVKEMGPRLGDILLSAILLWGADRVAQSTGNGSGEDGE